MCDQHFCSRAGRTQQYCGSLNMLNKLREHERPSFSFHTKTHSLTQMSNTHTHIRTVQTTLLVSAKKFFYLNEDVELQKCQNDGLVVLVTLHPVIDRPQNKMNSCSINLDPTHHLHQNRIRRISV